MLHNIQEYPTHRPSEQSCQLWTDLFDHVIGVSCHAQEHFTYKTMAKKFRANLGRNWHLQVGPDGPSHVQKQWLGLNLRWPFSLLPQNHHQRDQIDEMKSRLVQNWHGYSWTCLEPQTLNPAYAPSLGSSTSCWYSPAEAAGNREGWTHLCSPPLCSPTQTPPTSVGTLCRCMWLGRCSPWCQCGCRWAQHSYDRLLLPWCHTLKHRDQDVVNYPYSHNTNQKETIISPQNCSLWSGLVTHYPMAIQAIRFLFWPSYLCFQR